MTKPKDNVAPVGIDSLLSAVAQTAREERNEVIDLSAHLGEGMAITLKELGSIEMFSIPEAAAGVRKRNPQFPKPLCETIALLALAHVAPAGKEQRDELYVAIAKSNATLLAHIVQKYHAAFPGVTDFGAETDESKND